MTTKERYKSDPAYRTQRLAQIKQQRSRPEVKQKKRWDHIWERYKLTPEDYWAIAKAQGYRCASCNQPCEKMVVDHCHEKGHNRGLLCHRCNVFIGFVERQPDTFANCTSYLARTKA